MTEQEMRELFRQMQDEPVPADSLARVRMGVDRRTRRFAAWKIAAAVLVAGACAAGLVMFRTAVPVQKVPPPVVAQVVQSPPPPEAPVIVARTAPKPKRVRPRLVEPVAAVPVLIRIETPDPDVVILLVN